MFKKKLKRKKFKLSFPVANVYFRSLGGGSDETGETHQTAEAPLSNLIIARKRRRLLFF